MNGPAMRQPGASFFSGTMSGPVLVDGGGDNVSTSVMGGSVGSMGESRIANSERIRRQPVERIFRGAPKFWKITNRAERGNVKVWMGAFNGEAFPEGATADKRTWLQPGQSIMVPMEAGLHFVGNVFDPRAPEAAEVIERCGGFELETEASAPGKNAPVRPIGPPIGLPDFIVEPIDGRFRRVGAPVAVYDLYWNATKSRIVRRKGHDKDVLDAEKALLTDRIAEYTLDDAPIYGPDDRPIRTQTAPTADDGLTETVDDFEAGAYDGTPDMRSIDPDDESLAASEPADPVRTRPPRGKR